MSDILISTMNDLAGYDVVEVHGVRHMPSRQRALTLVRIYSGSGEYLADNAMTAT